MKPAEISSYLTSLVRVAIRLAAMDTARIAATNEHLPAKVAAHGFRADLLDRLSFEVVTLPPLRARKGDVMVLADHFGRRMASEIGWADWPGFGAEATDALIEYGCPGNVRDWKSTRLNSSHSFATRMPS